MKRVLHVTMSNAYGGAETVIFSIINNLSDKYEFCYTCPTGSIGSILKNNSINYKLMNNGSLNELKNIVGEYKPDIIHAHDFKASVLASKVGKKVKIISHLHTSHPWVKRFNTKSLIYILNAYRFNKIILVSETLGNEIVFKKYISNKMIIFKNPIDIEKIKDLSTEYREEKEYDVAFLGRLSDYKDPIRFINLVSKLKVKRKKIKAVIIGDGELKEQCNNLIKSLNLSDEIVLKGFKANPFPILKNSKILIMPSKVEALGLSAIESMVLGKPVIASNVGGLKEVVNEGCGFLCNSDNDYINAACKILDDNRLYREFSQGAIINSKKFIDINKYATKLDEIYKKL